MKRWLPVYLALGVSLGVIIAYLIAGGGSYKPLTVADPCEPRSPEVLAQRGVFDGILLSGLDGAACDLGVTREELASALTDDAALEEFSAANDIDRAAIEDAVRAGLIRAVDDAEDQGRLPTPIASIVRGVAENAPVSVVVDLFQALPGDPSLADVISALGNFGITLDDLRDITIPGLDDLLNSLGGAADGVGGTDLGDLQDLLPSVDPNEIPEDLGGLLPDGVDPDQIQQLQDDLQQLIP